MPLILNNPQPEPKKVEVKAVENPVKREETVVSPLQRKAVSFAEATAPRPMKSPTSNYVEAAPRRSYRPDDHLLIVDGHEKKIGKQSRYLVDMLSIDE